VRSHWVCVVCLGAAGCNPRGGADDRKAAPRLSCESRSYDFGSVQQGDRLKHALRIVNTGSAALHVLRVDRSRSCTGAARPDVLAPAASGGLEVECDTTDRPNRLADELVVHSDDPLHPEVTVAVEARVEPLLAFTSRTVDLQMRFEESASEDVWLTGRLAETAQLEVRSIDPPGPDAEPIRPVPGKPQGLRVSMTGIRLGRVAGQVVVGTGVREPSELTLLYSWLVRGNLVVDPTNPVIDVYPGGAGSVVVHVSSSRSDLRLDDAEVTGGPFEATFAHDDGSRGYAVEVRVVSNRIPRDSAARAASCAFSAMTPPSHTRTSPSSPWACPDRRRVHPEPDREEPRDRHPAPTRASGLPHAATATTFPHHDDRS
jgi:Protein of unknown function (DUF1573)